MELYKPPLRLTQKNNLFDRSQITDDLQDFKCDYFFRGSRQGNQGNIDLTVVSWIIDVDENIYIRFATYSGQKTTWKEAILNQLKDLMASINIGKAIVQSELRYLEIDTTKFREREQFEKEFLALKAKMKTKRE